MGLSENSVPLNPMVNDPYPYSMAISLEIYHIFRQTQISVPGEMMLKPHGCSRIIILNDQAIMS